MGARFRSWWQQIKRPLLVVGIVVASMLVIVTIVGIIGGYLFNWNWAGLRQKTLWDWLQLLIIPAVLAVVGFVINLTISRSEQEATKQRAQSEREIAEDCMRPPPHSVVLPPTKQPVEKGSCKAHRYESMSCATHQYSHFRGYNDGKLTSAKIGFCWEIKVMANQEHLDKLKEGVEAWNQWRREYPDIQPDLSGANLNGAKLSEIDLSGVQLKESTLREVDLSWADLSQTNLHYANLNRANLSKADLHEAALIGANLNEADLSEANLNWAVLIGAQLEGANLTETYLSRADLTGANLSRANLSRANLITATLVQTNLSEANLTGCFVHGTSVWSVQMKDTIQPDLVITFPGEPAITVDNLEIAQFIYLLLNNERIRHVIDTITSKVVLILGRFTDERKKVLDALRNELRKHGYLPVLFDFEKPVSRDFTETVRTLADLSRFIIADLTDPSSIPQELQAIVPDLEVPVQPLLLEAKREYSLFVDFRKYHWVLPVYLYKDQASLIASLKNEIIEPADKKARELAVEKAKRLERP